MGLYVLDLAHGAFDSVNVNRSERLVKVYKEDRTIQMMSAEKYDTEYRRGIGPVLKSRGVERLTKALDLFQRGVGYME